MFHESVLFVPGCVCFVCLVVLLTCSESVSFVPGCVCFVCFASLIVHVVFFMYKCMCVHESVLFVPGCVCFVCFVLLLKCSESVSFVFVLYVLRV